MKLPRDLSGNELARRLALFGYRVTRQTGSHLRLTTSEHGEHHLTIPNHPSLRVGTLEAISEIRSLSPLSFPHVLSGNPDSAFWTPDRNIRE